MGSRHHTSGKGELGHPAGAPVGPERQVGPLYWAEAKGRNQSEQQVPVGH